MRRAGGKSAPRMLMAVGVAATLLVSAGCSFDGVQNMSVPGVAGTQDGSYTLTAVMPTAGNVTVNAPVMMNDATVGSIGSLRVKNWQAELTLRLRPGIKVPAGSYARVGYTSVLGSDRKSVV